MLRNLVVTLIVLVAALTYRDALADRGAMKGAAKRHLHSGLALYSERDYDAAVAEFEKGYAIDSHPDFLFAMAQAHRLAGRCSLALPLYEQYLGGEPSEAQAHATRIAMDRCEEEEQKVAEAQEPAPVRPAVRPAASRPAPRRAPPPASRRWYQDVVGDALLGAGIVTLGASAVLFAGSSPDATSGAGTYGEYEASVDAARGRRTAAWVTVGLGSALVGGAVLRYWRFTRHEAESTDAGAATTSAGAWCVGDGCGFAVGGVF